MRPVFSGQHEGLLFLIAKRMWTGKLLVGNRLGERSSAGMKGDNAGMHGRGPSAAYENPRCSNTDRDACDTEE